MKFLRNDFVRHPTRPEWGIGRVTEEQSEDGIAMIHFPMACIQPKNITVALAQLIRVERIGDAVAEYHKAFLKSRNLPYRGVTKRPQEIIAIRESNLSAVAKARRAIAVSANLDLLVPVLQRMRADMKSAGYRSKRLLWDDRAWSGRLGLIGITVGSLGFGSQAAGIAALSRAVAVPLWLLLGSGGAFLGALVDVLADYHSVTDSTVIEPPRRAGYEEKPQDAVTYETHQS